MFFDHAGQPRLRYDELTQPSVEPVTLAEVRQHRKLDSDDTGQDSLIQLLIPVARRYAEEYTGRSFITRTFRATADAFPCSTHIAAWGLPVSSLQYRNWRHTPDIIELSRGPVTSVEAVTYQDITGAWQILDPSKYVVDLSGGRARLAPAFGTAWPTTIAQLGAVRIDFTAGFGSDEAGVPEQYRHWMLVRIGTIFENREEVAVLTRGRLEAFPVIDMLLEFDRQVVI